MSQPAAEYVKPVENNKPQLCKNCKHSIIDHLPDFKTGKSQGCTHVENEDHCDCNGFYI